MIVVYSILGTKCESKNLKAKSIIFNSLLTYAIIKRMHTWVYAHTLNSSILHNFLPSCLCLGNS